MTRRDLLFVLPFLPYGLSGDGDAPVPESPEPELRKLELVGWIVEYALDLENWRGRTHKEFIREREEPYNLYGEVMNAEELAKWVMKGLRRTHGKRHGFTVLTYYPVYRQIGEQHEAIRRTNSEGGLL